MIFREEVLLEYIISLGIGLSHKVLMEDHNQEQGGFSREYSGSRSRLENFERGQSWNRENRGNQSSKDHKGDFNRC